MNLLEFETIFSVLPTFQGHEKGNWMFVVYNRVMTGPWQDGRD